MDLELSVERVESNPQLVQIVPPNEVVVLISFELTLGDMRGMMNFCIPFNSIERIGNKLSTNSWISYGRRQASDENDPADQRNLKGALVELGRAAGRNENHDRRPDRPARGRHHHDRQGYPQPMVVSVEGVPKFRAHPGAFKGRKAIEIADAVQPEPQRPETRKPRSAGRQSGSGQAAIGTRQTGGDAIQAAGKMSLPALSLVVLACSRRPGCGACRAVISGRQTAELRLLVSVVIRPQPEIPKTGFKISVATRIGCHCQLASSVIP